MVAGIASADRDAAAAIYLGPKARLLPIHDALVAAVSRFGAFDTVARATYVSLRRRAPFALVGPASPTRVELGLVLAGVDPTDRLRPMPPRCLCTHIVALSHPSEVDGELVAWLRRAYDGAG
jgi:Domain of unknown function (DUF5655)